MVAKQERYSLDELKIMAETKADVWAIVSKSLTADEIAQVETVRQVQANAKILAVIEKDFREDATPEARADFLSLVPVFADAFAAMFKSFGMTDNRGGGQKTVQVFGHLSESSTGRTVRAINFPTNAGTLSVILKK